ncbi:MAG: T9SS type A sorting domain-containing protein [Chitinophagaceae bacterium]|nr:T9SS type A sorting domain-containing protein [Chitinophagaceae bacterium]
MKTGHFIRFLIIFLVCVASLGVHAQDRCGTMPLLQKKFERNPSLKTAFDKKEIELKSAILQRIQKNKANRELAGSIVIPVVFHIVMQNPSTVTDAQIQAQLDTLIKDYNGTNGDSIKIPSHFKPFFGKSEITFCLAKRTPANEPTTGIVRYSTSQSSFSNFDGEAVKHAATGGADAWNTDNYLNIWVCNLANDLLGYATFPGDGSPNEQGVVIDFGSLPGGSLTGFNGGKTLTHELGHYFNLYHPWGTGSDNSDCTGTDLIDDTPVKSGPTTGCPTGIQTDACSNSSPGIMYQNFMDYSSDNCLVMFTNLQVVRMEATIAVSRPSLLTSNGCLPLVLPDYDVQPRTINEPAYRLCEPTFAPSINIFNRGNSTLTSLTITARIDNADAITTNWIGSVVSLGNTDIKLSNITTAQGYHTLTIYTSNPNANTDLNTSNDTISTAIMYFPPVNAPLVEGFEGSRFPPDGWDLVNEDGAYGWEKIAGFGKTGNSAVYKDNFNDDNNGQKDYLRLPVVNISNADSAFISFQVAAATYTNPSSPGNTWDTLQVLISTDCGKTYTTVYKKWGADLVTRQGPVTTNFFPTANEWRKDSVNISSFISQGEIMLAFQNTTEHENNIFLDDINVRTVTVNPNLKAKGFLVTPVPTPGDVTVQFYPQPEGLKGIAIFSSLGQRVAQTIIPSGQANNLYTYDLKHCAPGVYIVRAYFNDRTITKKIVIAR